MAMLWSSADRIGFPRFEHFLLLHFMTCSDAVIVSCNPTTVLGCVVYFIHKNLPHTIQVCNSGLYIFIVPIYSRTTFVIYILNEKEPWSPDYIDEDRIKIKEFRKKVSTDRVVNFFTTIDSLGTCII